MKERYFLKETVDHREAVKTIQEHNSNLLVRFFDKKKRTLHSMELTYLPFWCHEYNLKSATLKDSIKGKIAIEPITKTPAILPTEYPLQLADEGMNLFPITAEENKDVAKEAIYWEAFQKEKRRKSIQIEFNSSFVLYMPFWIGYLKGETIQILPVDAITGKIDLKLKDAFLALFHQESS